MQSSIYNLYYIKSHIFYKSQNFGRAMQKINNLIFSNVTLKMVTKFDNTHSFGNFNQNNLV